MKVKIEKGAKLYKYSPFTKGKWYPVLECGAGLCRIIDDKGDRRWVLPSGCAFLNGGKWKTKGKV